VHVHELIRKSESSSFAKLARSLRVPVVASISLLIASSVPVASFLIRAIVGIGIQLPAGTA
jgi:hypothetical protein